MPLDALLARLREEVAIASLTYSARGVARLFFV